MDLTVTHQVGGIKEFQRTGAYPEHLFFSSPSLHRTWRLKLKEKIRNGNLKLKGIIIYNYRFNGRVCKIQEVTDGVANAKWVEIPVTIMMCD